MGQIAPGTTLKDRLLGFACGHLVLSVPVGLVLNVVWVALLFLLFLVEGNRLVLEEKDAGITYSTSGNYVAWP